MYHLSKPIQCFDAFLSHDWGTPGWMKVWALLLIFNSVPAAFVALGVCVCTCSLLMVGQLPGGWPTATISIYVSFLVILIFWQRIRNSLGCRVPTVFLDCVCIAQHDEELKKAGIQALGGFLTQSQELLILWSPRTFERLWCNFELACFLRQNVASSGKFQKRIRLVPLSMARLLGLAGLTNLWLWLAWLVWVIIESNAFLPGLAVLLASVAVLGPSLLGQLSLQTYLGMRQMQDFLDLYEQLGNFSVRSASCTCCLMNHQTTEGQRILCDRQQIFATIKRWYWTENADPESHGETFSWVVATQIFSYFHPELWGRFPICLNFSDGLKPPTSFRISSIFLVSYWIYAWIRSDKTFHSIFSRLPKCKVAGVYFFKGTRQNLSFSRVCARFRKKWSSLS